MLKEKSKDGILEEDPELQSVVDALIEDRPNLKVLEIGCGDESHVKFGSNAYIVGLDVSEKQLERNTFINEKILGDIETYNLPESEFDVIICWWVLEHLSEPDKALRNCYKALKKNGIMIMAIPNVMSLKGLLTKYTPHWVHVGAYRYVFREELAGIDDNVPFKTYLRQKISPESIKKFAREQNLLIERFRLYENPRQVELRSRHWAIDNGWKVLSIATKALTFGKVDADLTDLIAVLKKP
jgi:2-polyprenyl-3-methyl-5-hydroxy-6-metoxy-1,4-benzoquinol methylase